MDDSHPWLTNGGYEDLGGPGSYDGEICQLKAEVDRLRGGIRQVAYNNATPKGTREWLRSLLAEAQEADPS